MWHSELSRLEDRTALTMSKLSEVVILVMACLAPWAFGAEDASAGFVLGVGIVLVTVLATASRWSTDRLRNLRCLPSLALAGLVLLGTIQAVPLPSWLGRVLAPGDWAFRSVLVPRQAEHVAGDRRPDVPLPDSTLSEDPEATRTAVLRLAGAWLLLQAVLALENPLAAFRRFGMATAVNSCLLALVAMLQWLSWNGKVLWIREAPRPSVPWYSGGPFACHNHLAAYLNIGLGFTLALLLSSAHGAAWVRKRGAQLWPAYGAALLVIGLVASHSRGGMMAAVFSLVMVLLVARTDRQARGRLMVPGAAGLVVLGIVVPALVTAGEGSPFARLATITSADTDIRWAVWDLAVRSWWDRPLWGAGLGCFRWAVTPHESGDSGYVYYRAENEYLDILAEGGIVGLALMIACLGATIVLARRAIGTSVLPRDRALVLGGCFGGLALASQWLVDFSFHIPGVAVSAVVLGGFLCRLGLDARADFQPATARRLAASRLAGVLVSALAVVLLIHPFHQARAELHLVAAGLPRPDASDSRDRLADRSKAEVEQVARKVAEALRDRPDWAEGYLRHAAAQLRLYELSAAELISAEEPDPARVAFLSQPLWLRKQVHGGRPERLVPLEDLLAQEPIRTHLVPAARSFLEARRCCPVAAQTHIQLASLDYLLERGDTSRVYAGRALRLAGSDRSVLERAGILAVQDGELDFAARAWRQALTIDPASWERIADAAGDALVADVILRDVIPPDNGLLVLRFADRLYSTLATRVLRDAFLKEALARIPGDPRLSSAERLFHQGVAHARLGEKAEACKLVEESLLLEPARLDWRETLIDWLIASGEWKRARDQLAVGLELHPGAEGLVSARRSLAEAMARGAAAQTSSVPGKGPLATSREGTMLGP